MYSFLQQKRSQIQATISYYFTIFGPPDKYLFNNFFETFPYAINASTRIINHCIHCIEFFALFLLILVIINIAVGHNACYYLSYNNIVLTQVCVSNWKIAQSEEMPLVMRKAEKELFGHKYF